MDADSAAEADLDLDGALEADLEGDGETETGFSLSSSAFDDEGGLPSLYACADDFLDPGISPPLAWVSPPSETLSFVLIMRDSEGGFLHWALGGIPPDQTALVEGISPAGFLPDGAWELMNDFGLEGYGGPCPPPGELHSYDLELAALDVEYADPGDVTVEEVLGFEEIHKLGSARLSVFYEYVP